MRAPQVGEGPLQGTQEGEGQVAQVGVVMGCPGTGEESGPRLVCALSHH